jgi:hypothetical protein
VYDFDFHFFVLVLFSFALLFLVPFLQTRPLSFLPPALLVLLLLSAALASEEKQQTQTQSQAQAQEQAQRESVNIQLQTVSQNQHKVREGVQFLGNLVSSVAGVLGMGPKPAPVAPAPVMATPVPVVPTTPVQVTPVVPTPPPKPQRVPQYNVNFCFLCLPSSSSLSPLSFLSSFLPLPSFLLSSPPDVC